jgi:N-acetylmuramoyl-L-alanine amidase
MGIKINEILVILDDGHGLETLGKRTPKYSNGIQIKENVFNHATKELLINELNKFNINTYDVSPERTDTSLKTRTDRANYKMNKKEYNYYIFISIHFNAIGSYWNDNVGGIETYHYPGSEKGHILAKKVHNQLLKGTDLKDRHVKSANFHVLRETKMPAILCECGFMSNHIEANLMNNIRYQKECAREITSGIFDYFEIKKPNIISELEKLTKIISPQYHKTWMKHFNNYPNLNWLGFIKSTLEKGRKTNG